MLLEDELANFGVGYGVLSLQQAVFSNQYMTQCLYEAM
jgi:hypothetical protein